MKLVSYSLIHAKAGGDKCTMLKFTNALSWIFILWLLSGVKLLSILKCPVKRIRATWNILSLLTRVDASLAKNKKTMQS